VCARGKLGYGWSTAWFLGSLDFTLFCTFTSIESGEIMVQINNVPTWLGHPSRQ
jgi:hypothetical protein